MDALQQLQVGYGVCGQGSCISRAIWIHQPSNRCWDESKLTELYYMCKDMTPQGYTGPKPSSLRWANLPRLNTSTTEQAAAQTPAFPFGLHTITQTHHDEHNNYWAHTALRLHELSMSTQKATEAGITGWDNHGTKEWTPWDGGNLHPLTNLPKGNFPVPPHSPIPLG